MAHVTVNLDSHHADREINDFIKIVKLQTKKKVKRTLSRVDEIRTQKSTWLPQYQILGEFIHMREQQFQAEYTAGAFLHDRVFDSKGPKSAMIATSSLVSMLWPQETRKFRFHPALGMENNSEEKKFYEDITEVQTNVMDDAEGALATSLEESTHDDLVFGTSGIEAFKDEETKVGYRPWGVKQMSIDEGKRGQVNTIALEVRWSVSRIVEEYGLDNVHPEIQKLYLKDEFKTEFVIEILIEPRSMTDKTPNRGNRAMPWSSVHIDKKHNHLLKESGFDEIPIKVARFWKIIGEKYGRSPAMNALADVLEVNTIWESVTVAIEKTLDPPLGVLDDGTLGGGEIDTSAGGMTVFNVSGRAGEKNPVFPLFTVGEIKQTVQLIERLEESIADHFFVDRLLDFNNEAQMTLGEANIRDKLRNSTLGTIFFRQIKEKYTPLIQRTFNLLFEQGELGVRKDSFEHLQAIDEGRTVIVIPDSVAKRMDNGEDVYRIEYFTPAMRIIQAEEAEGIFRSWEFAGRLASFGATSALDVLDPDESVRRYTDIIGGPSQIKLAKDEVKKIRTDRGAQQQQAQQREDAVVAAQTAVQLKNSNLI